MLTADIDPVNDSLSQTDMLSVRVRDLALGQRFRDLDPGYHSVDAGVSSPAHALHRLRSPVGNL